MSHLPLNCLSFVSLSLFDSENIKYIDKNIIMHDMCIHVHYGPFHSKIDNNVCIARTQNMVFITFNHFVLKTKFEDWKIAFRAQEIV